MELRPIPGHAGYLAGDNGVIYSTKKKGPRGGVCEPRPLKFFLRRGYKKIKLVTPSGAVNRLVSRLICHAFHGPPFAGAEASHLDDDRLNNRPDNLAWETRLENASRIVSPRGSQVPTAKLTEALVSQLRLGLVAPQQAADLSGASLRAVARAQSGRQWRHVPVPPPTPVRRGRLPFGVRQKGSVFQAKIKRRGRTIHLGYFSSAEEAGRVALSAKGGL